MKSLSNFGIRFFAIIIAVFSASSLSNSTARATTYTWINTAGGNWSTNANWAGGVAPVNASGSTVDFSKIGLTNNATVNVDEAVIIGNMIIGNTNTGIGSAPYNWTFTDNGNSGNTVTLVGGNSTITVTNTGPITNLVNFSTLYLAGTNGVTFSCNSGGDISFGVWNWQAGGLFANSGTGTGSATINAGIYNNSGITEIVQNSATSPLILSGKNYYNVPTVVSNGWLLWNCGYTAIQVGSPITVNSGGTLSGTGWIPNVVTVQSGATLAPGTNDGLTIGTLIITNDGVTLKGGLSLSGNLFFKLHKGLTQSNDLVNMAGPNDTLTNLGTGTLTVTNLGSALVAGDTFYLFNKALAGGNNLTIVGGGVAFTNNLAVNGSISVTGSSSLPPPPIITGVSPASGSTAGGTLVTVTGTNFASGDTVTFGSTAGTGVTVDSSTNITVTTPAESAGKVNVKVTDTSSQSSTLTNSFTFVFYSSGSASIVITNIPTYGTYGASCFISGYVTNVNITTNALLVCDYWPNENPNPTYDAKLSPWGWFSRPTFANQLTTIQPNGTWSCNMPSNLDQYATEYAVMLVPTNFNLAAVNAQAGLPLADINASEAIVYADRVDTYRRQINWAGYGWWVKTAGADGNEFLAATGPGPNYYSDSTNNAWVDSSGALHLQITYTNSEWECVQIWNNETLGYGQYSCTLNANISNLDANVIFSMFTWSDDTDFNDREIDMEVSRWDYAFGSNDVEDYAVSPYNTGQTVRFGLPPGITNSTHTFTWESTNSVAFETYNGNYSSSPASSNILESSTITAQPIPPEGGEMVTMILWLYHGNPPLSGQPVQVTLSNFVFTPSGSSGGNGQDVEINNQVAGQPTAIAAPVGNSTILYFKGTPNSSYSVERSTNLQTGWVTIWTTNAPSGGLFKYSDNFDDLGGVQPSSAYYRLKQN